MMQRWLVAVALGLVCGGGAHGALPYGLAARTGLTLNHESGGGGIQPSADPSVNFNTIQAAIDAAALESPAGTVLLAQGLFTINDELSVHGAVTLTGSGMYATTIQQTVSKRCMTVKESSTVKNMTISGGNYSSEGAGAKVLSGTVSWCIVENNTTTSGSKSGAGVSFTNGSGQIDHCIVRNNTIQGGSWGAGIGGYEPSGDILIDCCLIYGNSNAAGSGGGIGIDSVKGKTITVRSSTITENTAKYNAGGVYINNGDNSHVVLIDVIAYGNTVNGSYNVNTFFKVGYLDTDNSIDCLIGGSTGRGPSFVSDTEVQSLLADKGILTSDPLFVSKASNDFHLQSTSPAIGSGTRYQTMDKDLDKISYLTPPSRGCYETR